MCGINRNDTEVCRSMTKKLRRAEGGSPDIDTTKDGQIRVSSTLSLPITITIVYIFFKALNEVDK